MGADFPRIPHESTLFSRVCKPTPQGDRPLSSHCEGVCTPDPMVCALVRGSTGDVRRGWYGQKSLIFMHFHGVFLGSQHERWSKQHNGKVSRLRFRLRIAYPVDMETQPVLRHEVWEWTPPEAQAYIRALEARVETLTSIIHALQEQVGTLQEQLNQTSRNSSRPPSSDPPQHQRPQRPRGQRRRGGQPGDPGSTRTLISVEDVDEVVVIKPAQCTHCQAPLSGDDPTPWRHQVIQIPPRKPVVTE